MTNNELTELLNKISHKQRRYMKKLGERRGYKVKLNSGCVLLVPFSKVGKLGCYFDRDVPRLVFKVRRTDPRPTSYDFNTTTYSVFCANGYGNDWTVLLEYKLDNTPNKELLLYINSIRGCDYTEDQRIMLEMLGGYWYIKCIDVIREYIQNLPDVS